MIIPLWSGISSLTLVVRLTLNFEIFSWRRNDKGNDGGCHEDGDIVGVKGADRSSCGSI